MRRLPVYLLLDVSENVTGELVTKLQTAVKDIFDYFRGEPMMLEAAHVSIITYADTVTQAVPLTPLTEIKQQKLKTGKSPKIGQALDFVVSCTERELQKTEAEKRGDLAPWLFIITAEGLPDHIDETIARLQTVKWADIGVFLLKDSGNAESWKNVTENISSDYEFAGIIAISLMQRLWVS